jgi:hypothetical protein
MIGGMTDHGFAVTDDQGIPVGLPSGATFPVMTDSEREYLEDKIQRYLADNHFHNVSDMLDIDKLVIFELMVHRWSMWVSKGRDYWDEEIPVRGYSEMIENYCVDAETEMMTSRGWKRWDELEVGESVLVFDVETESAAWQPLQAVHQFGPSVVARIQTRDHSSATTMHHDWLVRSSNQAGPVRKVQTWELGPKHALVEAASGAASATKMHSDEFVEFVAWYWTEGSASRSQNGRWYHCSVSQSEVVNPGLCKRIEGCLRFLYGEPAEGRLSPGGFGWRKTIRSDGLAVFSLNQGVSRALQQAFEDFGEKVMHPDFITGLTTDQLDLMIEVSQAADGWEIAGDRDGGPYRYLSQRSVRRSRAYEMVAVLAGRPVRTRRDSNGMWRTSLTAQRRNAPLRALKASGGSPVYDVEPFVWCPETPAGTWLARREGCIYYTGNSKEVRLLKKALGVDKTTRDRVSGDDSVAARWAKVLQRAREFGYTRNAQAVQAIESMHRVASIIAVHRNMDETERREFGFEIDDIVDVIDEEVAKYREIDEKFRFEVQQYWVRDQ